MVLTQGQINEYVGFTQRCINELQAKHNQISTRLVDFKTQYGDATGQPKADITTLDSKELDTRKLVLSKLKAEIDNMRSVVEKKLREVDEELVRKTK